METYPIITPKSNNQQQKHQQPHQKQPHYNKKQPPQSHYFKITFPTGKKNNTPVFFFFGYQVSELALRIHS